MAEAGVDRIGHAGHVKSLWDESPFREASLADDDDIPLVGYLHDVLGVGVVIRDEAVAVAGDLHGVGKQPPRVAMVLVR